MNSVCIGYKNIEESELEGKRGLSVTSEEEVCGKSFLVEWRLFLVMSSFIGFDVYFYCFFELLDKVRF